MEKIVVYYLTNILLIWERARKKPGFRLTVPRPLLSSSYRSRKTTVSALSGWFRAGLLSGLVALPAVAARAALPGAVDGQPLPSLAPMLERVTPAVVNVHTQTRVRVSSPLMDDPFFRRFFDLPRGRERVEQSLGSGVIVDAEKGYVLTNNHVIEGAEDIFVTLHDGRQFEGRVVGTDPDTDVAVLIVDAEDLTGLSLAGSDQLRVGDFVVAVGNPFGLGQTVTSGIVSALGRTGLSGLNFQNFIQTDASINPGNSGGALVNLNGELIGINTAIFSPSGGNVGIGFAIPSTLAGDVMQQLIEFGAVRRGSLGIGVQDLTPDLAEALGVTVRDGVLVARVRADSPGEEAGLQPGDIVSRIDRRRIRNEADLRNAEGLLAVGADVKIEVLREGRSMTLTTRIEKAELQELVGETLSDRLRSVTFVPLPAEVTRQSNVDGVMVASLDRRSYAYRRGLRPGDVITAVNRQPVESLQGLMDVVEEVEDEILFSLRRGRNSYLLLLD